MTGELSFYLEKYRKIKIPNESVRKEAQKIILKRFKEKIPLSDIRFIKGTLHIKTTGALKSEILMEKEQILSDLKEVVGEDVLPSNLR